jgi:hypothetical protein
MSQEKTNKKREKKVIATTKKMRDPNKCCKYFDLDGKTEEK